MKAESTRQVRSKKRMKVARVNRSLPLHFPTSKKSLAGLLWRMDVSGQVVPVADFPHRQTRKGVSVAINAGKRTLIRGAFIAAMRSGHRGVFRRKGKARLPIREAFTTRVSDVFTDSGFIPAIQTRGQSVFARAMDRLLPLELDKL